MLTPRVALERRQHVRAGVMRGPAGAWLAEGETVRALHGDQQMTSKQRRWRTDGVRIIRPDELDDATAQTLGMRRRAAVTAQKTGATKLWAGTVTIDAKAKTGAHHHGELESVLYVVSGLARMRWGDHLEYVAEAEAGDFIYVPPYVPHQEINGNDDLELHCVIARSGQEGLVVNLDITPVEVPELVRWIDDLHK